MFKVVTDVVLVFLLLTLNNFTPFSSASIASFEQATVSWEGCLLIKGPLNDYYPFLKFE